MNLPRAIQIHLMEQLFEDNEPKILATRKYKRRPNFFTELDDDAFLRKFRLSKSTCQYILNKIRHQLHSKGDKRSFNKLLPEHKLLLALRYYGSGNFLKTIGDFSGASITSVYRAIAQVSVAIASLVQEYVRFENVTTMQHTVDDFYRIAKMPNVVGTIGCMRVRLKPQIIPGQNFGHSKRYTLNVQGVCNAALEFQDILSIWPGSYSPCSIFNHSPLKARLENQQLGGYDLLGGKRYQGCASLKTPILEPKTEADISYNERHKRTLVRIQKCFALWRRRFPLLGSYLRKNMDTAINVIVACAVLHNIAIRRNEPVPPKYDTDSPSEDSSDDDE